MYLIINLDALVQAFKWNQVAIVYMVSDHNCITEYLNFLNSMKLKDNISHSQYGLAAESCNFIVLKVL